MPSRPVACLSLSALALLGACASANQSFAKPITQPSALPVPDAIQCVKKVLEANEYKIGRMDSRDGFIEGQKMEQATTPDVTLYKKGHLITVWAKPAQGGSVTTLEMSVVGQEDRRSYRGPTISQTDPNQAGKDDLAKVAAACGGETPAGS